MKTITKLFAASCFLLSLSFLNGQEKITLTIDQAVDYALENSKTLKSAAIDLEISKRASACSWNTLLPSASLSGTLARSNNIDSVKQALGTSASIMGLHTGQLTVADLMNPDSPKKNALVDNMFDGMYESEEVARWHPVGSLAFRWDFNIAKISKMLIAKKQYEAGKISWEKTCNETELQIRQLFYGILMMQEKLKIDEDSLNNSEARMKQAEINYRNGQVPELSLLNARVTYLNKKPEVEWERQQMEQQIDMFAFLLGLPYGQKVELIGSIDNDYERLRSNLGELDADSLYAKCVDQNSEILNLKKTIEVQKKAINASNFVTFTPSLSVGWGFSPTVSNIKQNWFDDKNYSDSGTLTITLAYQNLFDMLPFSANMQSIKDAKQKLAKTQIGLEQLYQNTEMKIHNSVADINKSLDNIANMKRNIEVAQSAYTSTLRGYNNGSQEELAVKDAENSLKQAKLGLMNEKLTFITTVMNLENQLNTKLTK
ncbi:TolC family protein [Treponema sp. C6A8]|uniref:TolC family protein n=1 Tax=Treponema sp. C6A8 TaxID=1410609 RepID=UPI00068744AC|nr:TolC family protein [Treponema sp. C6A8]